jgi:PAS domain S-box-containing protein
VSLAAVAAVVALAAAGALVLLCVRLRRATAELRRRYEASREREQQLQHVADAIPALISYVGSDWRYRFMNRLYETWFRCSPDQAIGKTTFEVLGKEMMEIGHPYMERALKGEEVHFEVKAPYPGGPRWVNVDYVPDFDASGKVAGFGVLVLDITQRKLAEDAVRQSEARLKEANQALQAADRRKDEFLATLAHELRNPLAAIRNAAAILKAMESSNPEARWVPEVIDRQLAQMSRLLEDLLDVSRLAHDKLALRRQRVELSEVVHNAIETCGPQLDAGNHAIKVALPEGPIFLHADPVRLEQVFSNLISNAAKYTPPGGHIGITGERRGDAVVISVKDDGVGISPEMLPRLFEIFSQGERALERSQGGLGVGLSLVRGLLELHGGRVEAKSDGNGQGSEFTVHLPLMLGSSSNSPSARSGAEESAVAARCRVLIADDARDSADSLAVILAMRGHQAHTAYDGEEAMTAAAQLRPEVVILDIRMPKRNGFEACRWIREQPWGKTTVLIALSGWGTEDDRRRTEEAGFDHHLVKPVAPEVLFPLVAPRPSQPGEAA